MGEEHDNTPRGPRRFYRVVFVDTGSAEAIALIACPLLASAQSSSHGSWEAVGPTAAEIEVNAASRDLEPYSTHLSRYPNAAVSGP